jgi:hypothetical protein
MSECAIGPNGQIARRDDSERGFATIQYVLAVGLSFVLLVLIANLLVDLYARGAVREALDEGTHAAVARDASPAACEQHARSALTGLLRGPMGRDVDVQCRLLPTTVTATADVQLPSWLPFLVPDWSFTVRAVAAREQ